MNGKERTPDDDRQCHAVPDAGASTSTPAPCTPMRDVKGKVSFITGGASGVGLGIAHALAQAGSQVVIGDCNQTQLEEAMKLLENAGGCVRGVHVDVTDRHSMERAASEALALFGRIHILVNNAGVITGTPLAEATYDDWDWVFSVNTTGVFNGVRAFLPHIKAHGGGGQIVTTASVNGLVAIGGPIGIYSASKFAAVGMMEALRGDLADIGIGVSLFCPGYIKSFLADAARNRPKRFSNTADKRLDAQTADRLRADVSSADEWAMDPLEAGRLVLRGIQNNDLYILTHPEFEDGIRDRNEALIASIPMDLAPPRIRIAAEQPILRNPVYIAERRRRGYFPP